MAYLVIDKKQTIDSLQKQFNTLYPFLKVEFFSEPHIQGKGSAKNKMIAAGSELSRIQKISKEGKVFLNGHITVAELESVFRNDFGLYMQVFRKSGNVWLETSATDNWTLEQQNEEGMNLAQQLKVEKENPDDHDMY